MYLRNHDVLPGHQGKTFVSKSKDCEQTQGAGEDANSSVIPEYRTAFEIFLYHLFFWKPRSKLDLSKCSGVKRMNQTGPALCRGHSSLQRLFPSRLPMFFGRCRLHLRISSSHSHLYSGCLHKTYIFSH